MTYLQHQEIMVFCDTLHAQRGLIPDGVLLSRASEHLKFLLRSLPAGSIDRPLPAPPPPVPKFPAMARR
jgi:hypothetical protein